MRLELAPALPAVVGDRVQLQQDVINLVINAIQAMASVTARRRELSIRSRQERSRSCARRGRGLRPRHRIDQPRPAVQSLLHDQACRHGDGTIDLPLDHRSARRQRMGDGQHAERRGVSFHPAGGMKAALHRTARLLIRRSNTLGVLHSPLCLVGRGWVRGSGLFNRVDGRQFGGCGRFGWFAVAPRPASGGRSTALNPPPCWQATTGGAMVE